MTHRDETVTRRVTRIRHELPVSEEPPSTLATVQTRQISLVMLACAWASLAFRGGILGHQDVRLLIERSDLGRHAMLEAGCIDIHVSLEI